MIDGTTLIYESYDGNEYLIEDLTYDKTYYWKVVVSDGITIDTSLTWSFTVEKSENTFESDEEPIQDNDKIKVDPVTVAVSSTVAISALCGYFAFSDKGKYGLLKFLAVPLYSRLKKDKILNNNYRVKIYRHIKENPGVHLRSIMNNFNLKNGAAIYHLTTLERTEYIKS